MAREHYAGIDIGGTKISVLITDAKGNILSRSKKKSKAEKGFDAVMDRVEECVKLACEEAGIEKADLVTAGVGAPSPITKDGVAIAAPNMHWKNAPLASALSSRLGVDVFAENDCNIGTYGEYAARYRQDPATADQTLVGLFMGTGLGAGLVLNQKLVTGDNSMGAEVGHMTI
ncbi:MAG: ROK family protein, partial [Polyangiaceae bacterium]|nr:ROK family protein [Polyangiaceae bacterium]